jgi:glycosyl transferase, family 25
VLADGIKTLPEKISSDLNIPIYVINLDRSPERLENITSQLGRQGLHFRRIVAVDAAELTEQTIQQVFDSARARRAYFVPMHGGEIACFLSHRRVWQTFVDETDAPFCVVLEDDAGLDDDFASVVQAVIERRPLDWDYVKLYARRPLFSWGAAPLADGHRLVRHLRQPAGTVGQVISRAGAVKLLARTNQICRPLDVELQFWWELGVRILSVDPPVVSEISSQFGGTTLRDTKKKVAGKVSRNLKRIVFRSRLLVNSAFHAVLQTMWASHSGVSDEGN